LLLIRACTRNLSRKIIEIENIFLYSLALHLEPCADVGISAAARRVILTGGGELIDFFSAAVASVKYRRRRRDIQ